MTVEECISKGLLKRGRPDRGMALNSLKTAEHKLGLAQKELDAKIYENAVISAYTAMFHSGRALLYKDGFKERSHYALSLYVSEVYGNRLERRFLHQLDSLRLERHELMYGVENVPEIGKEEAEAAISTARDFLMAIKGII